MHATVRSVIGAASGGPEDVCILDTEASPEHFTRGTARYADGVLVVVEPYFKSLETGRRMAALAGDLEVERVALVANKIRDDRELDAVRDFAAMHDLEIAAVIPFDDGMTGAEHAAAAPLDFAPDSPAVQAIGRLGREWVAGAGA